MDPSGRQTGLFCILHLKDLSMNDLSAVWCKSILHGILWLNLFFHYMNSKHFQWSLRSERGKNFHGKSGVPLSGQRASRSDFILQVLRPPWVLLWLQIMWILNTNAVSLLGLQELPAAATSRPTIPLDFSPIWLRDTERSAFVLPIFSMVRESCKPQQPVGWTFKDELRSTLA